MKTTTYGVGEMVADALKRGCREFIIGIGGSANFTTSLPASVFGRKGFDKVNSVLFPIQGIITALTFAINGAVMNMTGGNIRYAYAIDACLALINVIVIIAFVKDHKYNADWIAEQEAKGSEEAETFAKTI